MNSEHKMLQHLILFVRPMIYKAFKAWTCQLSLTLSHHKNQMNTDCICIFSLTSFCPWYSFSGLFFQITFKVLNTLIDTNNLAQITQTFRKKYDLRTVWDIGVSVFYQLTSCLHTIIVIGACLSARFSDLILSSLSLHFCVRYLSNCVVFSAISHKYGTK